MMASAIIFMLYLLLIGLMFGVLLFVLDLKREKKIFNNGKCKHCGKKLYLSRYNYWGDRVYKCNDCNLVLWVTYNCIDRKYKKELYKTFVKESKE